MIDKKTHCTQKNSLLENTRAPKNNRRNKKYCSVAQNFRFGHLIEYLGKSK
jgi:hypothetical protein